ncbi:TPA: tape measure protein [Serratia odorifera]
MAGNVIVTTTSNRVIFDVDQGSYAAAKKKIQSLKKEWEKVGSGYDKAKSKSRPKGDAAEALIIRQQAKAKAKAIKDEAAAEKALARERIRAERKVQQIRAKSIRFNTAASSYNLSGKQRAESLSQFGNLTRQFHAGKLAVGEYNAAVSALQANMRKTGRVGMRGQSLPVTAKVTKLDTSLIESAGGAITIAATVAVGGSIMNAGQELQSMESGLTAVTGSSAAAAKEMQYLRDQSNRLGLDLIQTGKDFTSFYAAAKSSMSNSQIKNLFEASTEYGTVLGATAESQSLALKAFNQMASKGQIYSEELKGQLAESLPGAVDIFVKSLQKTQNNANLTTQDLFKLMEGGKLMSKDILPAVADEMKLLARQGGALDKAIKSNRASYQRLKTAIQSSMGQFFEGGYGDSLTNTFDTLTEVLNDNSDSFRTWGHIAGQVIDGATEAFDVLYNGVVFTFRSIQAILKKLGVPTEALSKWADIGAYSMGVLLFAGSVWRLGSALKWVIGFLNPLTKLLGVMQGISALGGADAVGTAVKKGPKGKPTPTPTGFLAKGASKLIRGFGILGTGYMGYELAGSQFGDQSDNVNAARAENRRPWGFLENAARSSGLYDLSNSMYPPPALVPATPNPTFNVPGGDAFMDQFRVPGSSVLKLDHDTIKVDVNVKVDDGKITDLVAAEIADQSAKQINMMVSGAL